jgi:hypothetical protein
VGEAKNVRFGEMEWNDDAPGIRARETEVEGARWAIVRYDEGARREEWCEEGHRGYVVEGEIEYEFDDGRKSLRASEGPPLQAAARTGAATWPAARRGSFS